MTIDTYLDDLITYLTSLGYSNFYKNHLDDLLNNQIVLAPWGGGNPKDVISGEENLHQVSMSIMVKNENELLAGQISMQIYKLFRLKTNVQIGNTRFVSIEARSPPGFVTTTKNAAVFFTNYKLVLE